jgi:quercetin dioxygenase-like cupin family protein
MADRPKIVGPRDGRLVDLGGLGIRFMIDGKETGGQFALVEHPLEPRALGAPMHRHTNEDEYSYVLEGRMGAQLGDEVVFAEPGDLVFKPRGQWHTFWNAADEPTRLLELISPPGFENYFREMGELVADGPPDPERRAAISAKYELEVDPESVPGLLEEHGLRFGGAK